MGPELKKEMEGIFNTLDMHGDGLLDLEEVRRRNGTGGVMKSDALFRDLDVDNDDFISLDEFLHQYDGAYYWGATDDDIRKLAANFDWGVREHA